VTRKLSVSLCVFIVRRFIGSDALTQEQRDAINLASPSITNPFVTLKICKVIFLSLEWLET
jgi:hypothetical protein